MNGYARDCLGVAESREKLSSLVLDVISYVKSEKDVEEFLKSLKERIREDKELRDLATVIFREICDPEIARASREWGNDLEPAVRMAYLKCLLKLFEGGELDVEGLYPFTEDPSPKIRLLLASTLSLHADRSEVRSLLSGMLLRERRSEVRNVIVKSLLSRRRRN